VGGEEAGKAGEGGRKKEHCLSGFHGSDLGVNEFPCEGKKECDHGTGKDDPRLHGGLGGKKNQGWKAVRSKRSDFKSGVPPNLFFLCPKLANNKKASPKKVSNRGKRWATVIKRKKEKCGKLR